MFKKENIDRMKKEVFDYVTKCLECPNTKDYDCYKRKVAASYNYLNMEKLKISRDKKIKDEYNLVKFFKNIDEIISLSNDNKKIYLDASRNIYTEENLLDMIESSKKENKKILSKIRRVSKKDGEDIETLTKKSNDLKKLNALNKLYNQRIKFLECLLEKCNKNIVKK